MAKRRSQEELCADYKRERNNLYQQRRRLIVKQKKGKLKKREYEATENKIKSLTVKIDKYASKIFKCGKQYAALKKERMAILAKISRLKKRLKTERDMPRSERNKLLTEITELNAVAVDLGIAMGKDILELKKGKVGFVESLETGELIEEVVIWQVKSKVEGLISGGRMKFLEVGGESYSLDVNAVSALWAVDDYVAEITASQKDKGVKTPTITIVVNFITNTITIQ